MADSSTTAAMRGHLPQRWACPAAAAALL